MIRKPQEPELASRLRRTAESAIDAAPRVQKAAHDGAMVMQGLFACLLLSLFAYGALCEPTWPLRLFALTLEALFFGGVYWVARFFR